MSSEQYRGPVFIYYIEEGMGNAADKKYAWIQSVNVLATTTKMRVSLDRLPQLP